MRRAIAFFALAFPIIAAAQTMLTHQSGSSVAPILTEPGQAVLSAIQEIVTILEIDLKTDWTKVNIEALR